MGNEKFKFFTIKLIKIINDKPAIVNLYYVAVVVVTLSKL